MVFPNEILYSISLLWSVSFDQKVVSDLSFLDYCSSVPGYLSTTRKRTIAFLGNFKRRVT